jgi:hypothetical protein
VIRQWVFDTEGSGIRIVLSVCLPREFSACSSTFRLPEDETIIRLIMVDPLRRNCLETASLCYLFIIPIPALKDEDEKLPLFFSIPIILPLKPIVQLPTGPDGIFLYDRNSVYLCNHVYCSLPGGFIIIEF